MKATESISQSFFSAHLLTGSQKMRRAHNLVILVDWTVGLIPTWVAMVAVATFPDIASPQQAVPPADSESESVVDFVISGRRHNYAGFGGVSGEMSMEQIDSPQTQERMLEAYEHQSDSGVTSGLLMAPLEEIYRKRTSRFTLSGSKLRFDGTFTDPKRVRIITDDQQVVFESDHHNYRIDPRDLESGDWRDPREVFFNEALQLESELLNSVVHVLSRTDELLSLRVDSGSGWQFEATFDVKRNFLPIVCWELKGPNGEVSTEITYSEFEINNETYWFPNAIISKSWGVGGAAPLKVGMSLDDAWNQQFRYTVANLEFGQMIPPETFVIKPSDGTFVVDRIHNTTRHIGERPTPPAVAATARGRRWLPLALTGFVVCIISYLLYRKHRMAKS